MPAVTKKTVAIPTKGQHDFAAGKVDPAQALKACKALAAHAEKVAKQREADNSARNVLPLDGPQGDLKDRSNTVFMQLAIKQLNPQSKVKPVRIPVPNPVHRPGQVSVCLLVKDPQREYKDLLVEQNITSIARVVGVTKLKGKFKPFDARRDLVKDHDLFLADERIVSLVPKICGKVFFDAKKNPITVDVVQKRHLKQELDSAISSAYYLQNKGSTSSIKLGYLSSHTPEQLQENLLAAIPAVISRIPGGWNNVQNIEVKTGSSVSLPIWNCALGLKNVVKVNAADAAPAAAPAAVEKASEKKAKGKKAEAEAKVEEQKEAESEGKKRKKTATKAVEEEVVVESPKSPKSPAPVKATKKSITAAVTADDDAAIAGAASPASKKRKASSAATASTTATPTKKSPKAAAKSKKSAEQEDAQSELSPSDHAASSESKEAETVAADAEAAATAEKPSVVTEVKKPSPRKTRSATAAAVSKAISKAKAEAPVKKTKKGEEGEAKKKTTSSTTRAASAKGKAKK
ncbi:proteasome-interacting protein cic1 [Thecaphora frezii]